MLSSEQRPSDERRHHQQSRADVEEVRASSPAGSGGIEAHLPIIGFAPAIAVRRESISLCSAMLRAAKAARALLAVAVVGLAGCATQGVPQVPAGLDEEREQVLVLGREVYVERCANCHGNAGQGGRGGALADGAVIRAYPDASEQVQVVSEGLRNMPSFGEALTLDEIRAVVEFTRSVLQ